MSAGKKGGHMICKNCGQEVPEGNFFCQNCGYPIAAEESEEKKGMEVNLKKSQNDSTQNNFEQESNVQNDNEQDYTQPYNNNGQGYDNQAHAQSYSNNQAYDQSYANTQTYNQSYTEASASVQQDNTKKKLNLSVIGLAVIVILAVLFLKSCFFGSSYKTPLDDMLKIVNKKQTNIDKIADVVVPAMLSDTYEEVIDLLKSNKEYKKDFKKLYDKTLPDTIEDAYDEFYDNMENIYGKNIKLSYKIEDKEKLDKDERNAIASAYSSFAQLSSGITDCIEALENCTELKEKELKKLVKQIEALEKKLDKFKVSSGYVLDVEFTIKGKEDETSQNMDIVVIKADGDWMIDYLSTAMLNSGAYDLDELDEMTDELDLKQLNSELKVFAKYLKQIDKDMIEDAMDNWDDIMDFAF